uniref:Uncharacterized protein n=1 Tax=Spironucleus salmonicida TaxID=348837 RepID=V6LXZ8_9EUKA|eukprot:EST49128.1 Hypothetical protein SS50377_10614 [Spironucleus salmonicida]
MPPRSTSSRRNLKGSSFLLQNEEILNEIRQPLTPPAVHPHNLGQELEAIRSHQRAHDDLLRDLTHQIAQTNVTVFRQKVAENFTNLKEGFTLIQKERRVEKESLSQHKKDTGRQIKEFQGDFLEFAQILKRFEGRLQDMQAQALRRELKQQSQIAVLKQVLKRSGVYNHFLMGEHGAPAAVQSKAAAALQHGSSPAEIEALLQKQAALFDQKLQQLDEKLVQNEQITHQLIEQRTTLHTQQTAQIQSARPCGWTTRGGPAAQRARPAAGAGRLAGQGGRCAGAAALPAGDPGPGEPERGGRIPALRRIHVLGTAACRADDARPEGGEGARGPGADAEGGGGVPLPAVQDGVPAVHPAEQDPVILRPCGRHQRQPGEDSAQTRVPGGRQHHAG